MFKILNLLLIVLIATAQMSYANSWNFVEDSNLLEIEVSKKRRLYCYKTAKKFEPINIKKIDNKLHFKTITSRIRELKRKIKQKRKLGGSKELLLKRFKKLKIKRRVKLRKCTESALTISKEYISYIPRKQKKLKDSLLENYSDIKRMNYLKVQENLQEILSSSNLNNDSKNYYLKLESYYETMKDYYSALENNELIDFRNQHAINIDSITGEWSKDFKDFAIAENLELPIIIFSLPEDVELLNQSSLFTLYTSLRKSIGDNIDIYYDNSTNSLASSSPLILESMRKVKSNLLLLDYRLKVKSPLFTQLNYKNKPSDESLGLQSKQRLVTSWAFFPYDRDCGCYPDKHNPDITTIKRVFTKYFSDESVFHVLNLEQYPLTGKEEVVRESVKQLKIATRLIHEVNPNLLIGFYRLLPRREINATYHGYDSEEYKNWQTHNDKTAIINELENSVDLIIPSLYTLHLGANHLNKITEKTWEVYALANIAEARRISDGKPVIPYLAQYYHPNGGNNLKGWELLEPEIYLYQLLLTYEHADGATIYHNKGGDWYDSKNSKLQQANEIFVKLKRQNRLNELRTFYDDFFEKYEDQMLEKLKLEIKYLKEQNETQRSRLRRQLDAGIDIWASLKDVFE